MGKPKAPAPTPPRETSAAQTGTNVSTAIANSVMGNISEYTPEGSTTVNQTGSYSWTDPYTNETYDVPTFTRTTELSEGQQAIYDQNQAAQLNLATLANDQSGRIGEILSNPFNLNTLPEAGQLNLNQVQGTTGKMQSQIADAGDITRTYGTDFSQDRQRVEDALFARLENRLGRDQSALETRLANQGINIGTEAYTRAMGDFGQNRNDARLSAILGAGQEQSRLAGLEAQRAGFENAAQQQAFGQNAMQADFGNSVQQQMNDNLYREQMANNQLAQTEFNAQNALRNQSLQEQLTQQNQPINQITALMSGSQVSMPQFMGANIATIPTTDNAGIINNYDQLRNQQWQQQMAARQSLFGGLLGMGANIIASDRDLKKNIKPVGKVYEYNYKDDPKGAPKRVGVMAQEVERYKPEAVVKRQDGKRMVDYGSLFGMGA